MIFTGADSLEGVRVRACLRRAGSQASGYGAQLQDHAKAARGLTGVADADKVRESVVFYVDRKTCKRVFAPRNCCRCIFPLNYP